MTQDTTSPAIFARIPETDDAPDDTSTPFTIVADDRFVGTIEDSDVDWVAFEMVEGDTYRFAVAGAGDNGIVDPRLSLLDADGQIVVEDDDGGEDFNAEFVYTARVSGTFYLAVDGAGDIDAIFREGRYALTAEDLSAEDTLTGGNGADRIVGSNFGATLSGLGGDDVMFGGARRDDIDGGRGNDDLRGGLASDTMSGGRGDDRLSGNQGRDLLSGNNGDDTIYGGKQADTIRGLNNADRLLGGDGDDTMSGGNGLDRVFGGAGDDTISGGRGLDFLRGGEGADEFLYDRASGNDQIGDFTAGEDTLSLDANLFGGADLTVGEALNSVGVFADGDSVLTFLNGSTLTLKGVDFGDIVDDVVIG